MFSRFKIQDIFDYDKDKFEPRPYRAWAVIFFVEIILIVLVLTLHLYISTYMRSSDSFKPGSNSVEAGDAKLNRRGLTEVITMFEVKNAQFQNLLASQPQITDPSVQNVHSLPAASEVIPVQKKTIPKNTTGFATTPVSSE